MTFCFLCDRKARGLRIGAQARHNIGCPLRPTGITRAALVDALRQSDRLEELPGFLLRNGYPAIASVVNEVLAAQRRALRAAGVEP